MYLNFQHDGNLPDGTKVRIYVGDKYNDYEKVNIYYYNQEKNRMDAIKLEVEVLEGYVEFELDHCSEYIITRAVFNTESSFNLFMVIAIIELIIIVGYILYIKVFHKNSKKTRKKKVA